MTSQDDDKPPGVLHNMSVPPTSQVQVARAAFPGLRFCLRFPRIEGRWLHTLRDGLARGGWRKAWTVLESRDDAPTTGRGAARRQEDLERHMLDSLHRAGVPDRLGVFLDEFQADPGTVRPLPPAAILAVLARRSGRLYVPSRRLEPSLADPCGVAVLFFPEEEPR